MPSQQPPQFSGPHSVTGGADEQPESHAAAASVVKQVRQNMLKFSRSPAGIFDKTPTEGSKRTTFG